MTSPDSSSRYTPHFQTVYSYILDTAKAAPQVAPAPSQRDLPTARERETNRLDDEGCEAGNGNSAVAAAVVVDTVKRPSGSIIRAYVGRRCTNFIS